MCHLKEASCKKRLRRESQRVEFQAEQPLSERTQLTRPPSLYHLLALWPLARCLVSWPLVPSSAKRGEKHLPIIWHSSINWNNYNWLPSPLCRCWHVICAQQMFILLILFNVNTFNIMKVNNKYCSISVI